MFAKTTSISSLPITARRPLSGALLPALALLIAAGSGQTPAHAGDSATGDAQAAVISGFQLQNVEALQFGQIIPSGLGGSVMIDASSGNVSTIGQVISVGSNQTRARFTVKAAVGVIMILSGDPTVLLTRVGGTDTMTATLIHRGTTGLAGTTVFGLPIGLIATAPDQEIHTGGALVVPGNQAKGVYEGSFTLMVSYL